jgi:hypothetical protein
MSTIYDEPEGYDALLDESNDFFGKLLNTIEQGATSKGGIFKLQPGTRATVRLISDVSNFMPLVMHERFLKGNFEYGYTIPCPHKVYNKYRNDGEMCPFCAIKNTKENARKTYEAWCITLYDYTDKAVKIYPCKLTDFSPLSDLAKAYTLTNCLIDRDLELYSYNKEGSSFPAIGAKISPKKTPLADDAKKIIYKEFDKTPLENIGRVKLVQYARKALANAYCPSLLEENPVYKDKWFQEPLTPVASKEPSTDDILKDAYESLHIDTEEEYPSMEEEESPFRV